MVFVRTFEKDDGQKEKIFLSLQEEREAEQIARQEHNYLMRRAISDARNILKDENIMDTSSHLLGVAFSLFRQQANPADDYKTQKCEDKFLRYWGKFAKKKPTTAKPKPTYRRRQ